MNSDRQTPKNVTPAGRRAIIGAWLAFYVDMFDIYLPILVLAPAMIYFRPDDLNPATTAILSGTIFAVTLIGRPIGAALFGHLGDKFGRRKTTLVATLGFGAITLAIALIPGYETIGLGAIALLIGLRFVDGIFLGGQYTVSTPLALEYTPREKRGLIGGFIKTGYPLAYTTTAGLTFLLLQVVPAGDVQSPYVQWGWRIPFVIGALIAFAFAIWFARNVQESVEWTKAKKSSSPIRELLEPRNRRTLLQVFVLMTGMWLSQNMVGAALPPVLRDPVGLSSDEVSLVLFFATGILVFGYVGAGALSQHIGRRTVIVASGLLTALLAPALLVLIASTNVTGFFPIFLLVTILSVTTGSIWGVVATYINERFPVAVRSSGFGIGYSAAVVIPAFYAFYQAGLSSIVPLEMTPAVLLAVAGTLIVVGGLLGPETRDVDLSASADSADLHSTPTTR